MSKVIKIEADKTGTSGGVHVRLADAQNNGQLQSDELGLVQSVVWKAKVGEISSCSIETLMNPAQIEVALENTQMDIRLHRPHKCPLCRLLFRFSKEGRAFRKLVKSIKEKGNK